MHFLMLTFFLIFCRSHPFIGRVINAALLNIVSIKIVHFSPEGAFYGFTICYGTPLLVFYVTQNVTLTGISSLLQFSLVISTIKSNLMEAISFTDPEVFAQKSVQRTVPLLILLQVLTLYVVYRLNDQTTELSKATRKAEEALDQQKTFVYSFSHEMRNPMNSLLGNLDLALMSQQITPEIREMINTAKICGVLLLNLINTVLDAGKLDLGKLEVNPVPTRVHDVFQRVWTLSHEMITRKDLNSHLKVSRQVPSRLILDSHRLNQVLMNLIGNATKFTEYGSILLAISWLAEPKEISEECFRPVPYDDEGEGVFEKEYNLYAIKRQAKSADTSLILTGDVKEFSLEGISQPKTEEKGVLKIVIRDTGCGISPEELSKLFQKFSQVGQVTTKRQMGTGLGLFISKELVENMGGEIRVYSKPKVGTTFIICIPTTALPTQPQSEQQLSISDNLIPRIKSQTLTTIVADDSAFNVSLVCNFYSKIGVKVLATASNGQSAYDKYLEIIRNSGRLDIITLDIDMPIMDGKQVCKKIRQYERENNLKRSMIVLISGNYEEEDMYNMLSKENESKADCFLKKPLVFEELCFALYKYHCCNPS